ncbi:IS5 family transposase ISOt6 [Orientia tsutsugamushi]|uniref:IS5 family transposase ISOt6 n=1 Tax=Orientia tsutsugamushi TaxID=784 RepID=A0A2U3RNH2_ORITS|nr:DDE superendonuclease family protein [Orientia tsutsugamushi str. Karp]SPR14730.1 IS5 family transposase ISOt6 [Orientia tsutsugamushi]
MITDTGYQGIQKTHNNSELQKKKSKKNPLTKNDKKNNRRLAGERVINENVIGMLKRFKIIADKYRNRRKRFDIRFNLISGIYNFELLGGLLYFYLNSSLQPSIISLYTSLLPSYPIWRWHSYYHNLR